MAKNDDVELLLSSHCCYIPASVHIPDASSPSLFPASSIHRTVIQPANDVPKVQFQIVFAERAHRALPLNDGGWLDWHDRKASRHGLVGGWFALPLPVCWLAGWLTACLARHSSDELCLLLLLLFPPPTHSPSLTMAGLFRTTDLAWQLWIEALSEASKAKLGQAKSGHSWWWWWMARQQNIHVFYAKRIDFGLSTPRLLTRGLVP